MAKLLPLSIAVFVIQVTDIFIHVSSGNIEVSRLIFSSIIIFAAVFGLFIYAKKWPHYASMQVYGQSLGAYVISNAVFLIVNGALNESGRPRIAFFIFVTTTIILMVTLIKERSRCRTQDEQETQETQGSQETQ